MLRFTELTDSKEPITFEYPGNSLEEAYDYAKTDGSPLGVLIRRMYEGRYKGALRFKTDVVAD